MDALVNMSQMTVSQMGIHNTTPSRQQRQHWLGEQALAWSGLPVVTVRPTMFLETFLPLAGPAVRDRGRIELPFGRGKTNPVAAADVARVVAAVLADPGPHLGRVYELTGPRSQDMHGVAREFSDALNREVAYCRHRPRGLGGGAETGGVAGAPDRAPGDDGRAAPGGPVRPAGGRRGAGDRPAGDGRPGVRVASRGRVRRSSVVKVRHAESLP